MFKAILLPLLIVVVTIKSDLEQTVSMYAAEGTVEASNYVTLFGLNTFSLGFPKLDSTDMNGYFV